MPRLAASIEITRTPHALPPDLLGWSASPRCFGQHHGARATEARTGPPPRAGKQSPTCLSLLPPAHGSQPLSPPPPAPPPLPQPFPMATRPQVHPQGWRPPALSHRHLPAGPRSRCTRCLLGRSPLRSRSAAPDFIPVTRGPPSGGLPAFLPTDGHITRSWILFSELCRSRH